MEGRKLKRDDLVHPGLSYKIVGLSFEVFKELGSGHKESLYQKAYSILLNKNGIRYKEQVYYPVKFQGRTIGKNFFDFLIEDKIVVELKKNAHFSKAHIDQVLNYLKVSKLKLAILISFGNEGAICKRIINFDAKS
jgi:GxxExxY protein